MPASFLEESVVNITLLLKNRLIKDNFSFSLERNYFTPRRIIIIFYELKILDENSKEFVKGPRIKSSDAAIKGFAKAFDIHKDELIIRNTDKGKYYFFKNNKKPNVSKLLAEMLETELKKVTWKKSMKWGSNHLKWARPLRNILCLYGNKKLTFAFEHLVSNDRTIKDHILDEKLYKVKSLEHYFSLMSKFEVMVDQEERIRKIINNGNKIAKKKKLFLKQDKKLLKEVSNLIEKPYLFLAMFKKDFLKLPEEILITTMKKNQKYFPLYDSKNKLSNYFMLVSNKNPNDKGKIIVEGNQRVINARLEDADFFWNRDKKNKIQSYSDKLKKIIFHNELGTIYQKIQRLKMIAKFIIKKDSFYNSEQEYIMSIVSLLKNDLATEIVKEFPELQGIMGGYYTKEENYNISISNAIADQYKPLGPKDNLPKTGLAKLVALIDKVDSLVGFFIIGRQPSSSKDPFALRRTALGIIRIIIEGDLSINLSELITNSINNYKNQKISNNLNDKIILENMRNKVLYFILERYENLIKNDKSINGNLLKSINIDISKLNLISINKNLLYLTNFFNTSKGLRVLSAIKRVINIIEIKNDLGENRLSDNPSKKLFKLKEEYQLFELLNKHTKDQKVEYKTFINNILLLINPIEKFFDNVQIHHQNSDLKKNRLALLLFLNNRVSKTINFLNLIKGN